MQVSGKCGEHRAAGTFVHTFHLSCSVPRKATHTLRVFGAQNTLHCITMRHGSPSRQQHRAWRSAMAEAVSVGTPFLTRPACRSQHCQSALRAVGGGGGAHVVPQQPIALVQLAMQGSHPGG